MKAGFVRYFVEEHQGQVCVHIFCRQTDQAGRVAHQLAELTMKRRDRFASKQVAFEILSQKGFSQWDKAVLWDYIDHGFKNQAGAVSSLAFNYLIEGLFVLYRDVSYTVFGA